METDRVKIESEIAMAYVFLEKLWSWLCQLCQAGQLVNCELNGMMSNTG